MLSVVTGNVRAPYDLPLLVDAGCAAFGTPERSQIGHFAILVEERMGFAPVCRRIADNLALVIGIGGPRYPPRLAYRGR